TVPMSAEVPAASNGPLGPFAPQAASAPVSTAAARERTAGRRSVCISPVPDRGGEGRRADAHRPVAYRKSLIFIIFKARSPVVSRGLSPPFVQRPCPHRASKRVVYSGTHRNRRRHGSDSDGGCAVRRNHRGDGRSPFLCTRHVHAARCTDSRHPKPQAARAGACPDLPLPWGAAGRGDGPAPVRRPP